MSDIFEIVKENDFKRLKDNLKYVNINAKDEKSFSLLHYAVLNNNLEMVRYLLLNNIDVNSQNDRLDTALHIAVTYNYLGIFKVLVKNNADINIKNIDLETPLMISIKLKRDEMSEILLSLKAEVNIKNSKDENILFLAMHSSNINLVEESLSKNPNLLYSVNMFNDTLLHEATKLSDVELTKLLLSRGILPNVLNNDLETPIFNAAREHNLEIASLLIDSGALVEFVNKYDETIVDLGNDRFNDFVKSKTYSVKYSNYQKNYPLIVSVILNDEELFYRYLNRIESNKKDDHNLNALDYAIKYDRKKFIKELIKLK